MGFALCCNAGERLRVLNIKCFLKCENEQLSSFKLRQQLFSPYEIISTAWNICLKAKVFLLWLPSEGNDDKNYESYVDEEEHRTFISAAT